MPDLRNLLIIAPVVAVLIGLTVGAMMFRAEQGAPQQALPPVEAIDVAPGYLGQHKFGLWTLFCENIHLQDAPAEAPPVYVCRANARARMVTADNRPLLIAAFNVLMMKTQEGAAINFRLPPGASASDHVNFAIDDNMSFKVPLTCTETACTAQGALPADAVEQLKAGKVLVLVYTVRDKAGQERQVRVDQQLHGFAQAFAAITSAMASAP